MKDKLESIVWKEYNKNSNITKISNRYRLSKERVLEIIENKQKEIKRKSISNVGIYIIALSCLIGYEQGLISQQNNKLYEITEINQNSCELNYKN